MVDNEIYHRFKSSCTCAKQVDSPLLLYHLTFECMSCLLSICEMCTNELAASITSWLLKEIPGIGWVDVQLQFYQLRMK